MAPLTSTLVLVLVLLGFAAPALADGPIATTEPAQLPAPEPAAAAPPLTADVPAAAESGPPVVMGPCGPEKIGPDGKPKSDPHGMVEAGVGTGGYRQVAGTVCQPLGDKGAVSVSAGYDTFDWGRR